MKKSKFDRWFEKQYGKRVRKRWAPVWGLDDDQLRSLLEKSEKETCAIRDVIKHRQLWAALTCGIDAP
jgi:uncharacterized OsmC-like protein